MQRQDIVRLQESLDNIESRIISLATYLEQDSSYNIDVEVVEIEEQLEDIRAKIDDTGAKALQKRTNHLLDSIELLNADLLDEFRKTIGISNLSMYKSPGRRSRFISIYGIINFIETYKWWFVGSFGILAIISYLKKKKGTH